MWRGARRCGCLVWLMLGFGSLTPQAGLGAPLGDRYVGTSQLTPGRCTVEWTGEADEPQWGNAQNWRDAIDPKHQNRLPGPFDHACVAASETVVVEDSAVAGSITTSAPISVEGSLEWTGWSGGSHVAGGGVLTIEPSGTLLVSGPNTREIGAGQVIRNRGTTVWLNGALVGRHGARFVNAGTFDARSDDRFFQATGEAPLFHNTGLLTRTAAANGAATFDLPFKNDGSVRIRAGTVVIRPSDPAITQAGSFGAASEATLKITGGGFTSNGATISGRMELNTGSIGGPGELKVTGVLAWTSTAKFVGSGRTTIAKDGRLLITGGNTREIGPGYTILNEGRTIWRDGAIVARDGARFVNAGTFDARSDDRFRNQPEEQSLFHNTGKLTRSKADGTSLARFDLPFENDGVVDIQEGRVSLAHGDAASLQSGIFQGRKGASLSLDGGAFRSDGATIRGRVTLTRGTIGGPNTLEIEGVLDWTSTAEFEGTGRTTIEPGGMLRIVGSNSRGIGAGYTIHNKKKGVIRWLNGSVFVRHRATIRNDGEFDARAGGRRFLRATCAQPRFLNSGTLTRRSAAQDGAATIEPAVESSGTVDIRKGTVRLTSYEQEAAGILRIDVRASGGKAPGGKLVVGKAILDGRLVIAASRGHEPSPSTTFEVLRYEQTRAGFFRRAVGTGPSERAYTIRYKETEQSAGNPGAAWLESTAVHAVHVDTIRIGKLPAIPTDGPRAGLIPTDHRLLNPTVLTVEGRVKPALAAASGTRIRLRLNPLDNPGVTGDVDEEAAVSTDGRFSRKLTVFFETGAPTPRRLVLQTSVTSAGTLAGRVTTRLDLVDLDGLLATIRPAAQTYVGRPPLDLLTAVRKVYQPATLLNAIIVRGKKVDPITPRASDLGQRLLGHRELLHGDELVDIGHALLGAEGSDRLTPWSDPRTPEPAVRIPRGDLVVSWAGDLGSAIQEWVWSMYYLRRHTKPLDHYIKVLVGRSELVGDIDGVNLGAEYDQTRDLQANLSRYYAHAASDRFRRFIANTRATGSASPALTLAPGPGPPRLTSSSRAFIAQEAANFAQLALIRELVRESGNPCIPRFEAEPPEAKAAVQPGSPQIQKATDLFARFLEQGLAAETGAPQ